jgi:hypothetical protein
MRGVHPRDLTHRELLDAALALMVEPLADDPERLETFLREHLYAPLPGSDESRKRAQQDIMAAAGLTPEKIDRMLAAQQKRAQPPPSMDQTDSAQPGGD